MAQPRTARPARRALVPAAVVLGLALSGCSATNEITTTLNYDPSDGVSAEVGDLRLGNLILLTAEEGAAGTLIGFVSNESGEDATVTLALGEGASTDVDVPAYATVLLGPDKDETVDVEASPSAPGTKTDLTVSAAGGGSTDVQIPVLDGTLPEYADLVPGGGGQQATEEAGTGTQDGEDEGATGTSGEGEGEDAGSGND